MKKLYFLFALLFLFSIFSPIYAMQEQNLRSLVEKVLEKQTQTKTGKEVLAEVKSLFLACEQSQMHKNIQEKCSAFLREDFPNLENKRKEVKAGWYAVTEIWKLSFQERVNRILGENALPVKQLRLETSNLSTTDGYQYWIFSIPRFDNLSLLMPSSQPLPGIKFQKFALLENSPSTLIVQNSIDAIGNVQTIRIRQSQLKSGRTFEQFVTELHSWAVLTDPYFHIDDNWNYYTYSRYWGLSVAEYINPHFTAQYTWDTSAMRSFPRGFWKGIQELLAKKEVKIWAFENCLLLQFKKQTVKYYSICTNRPELMYGLFSVVDIDSF